MNLSGAIEITFDFKNKNNGKRKNRLVSNMLTFGTFDKSSVDYRLAAIARKYKDSNFEGSPKIVHICQHITTKKYEILCHFS